MIDFLNKYANRIDAMFQGEEDEERQDKGNQVSDISKRPINKTNKKGNKRTATRKEHARGL